METISNFEEVRADGKVIPAGMTLEETRSRGWLPCKVIGLRWSYNGKLVEFSAPPSVLGRVVSGANFVAAIIYGSDWATSRLLILSPNGLEHGRVNDQVPFHGRELTGRWGWFEQAVVPGPDIFGAAFQTTTSGDYRCDVDARALRVAGVFESR